MFQLHCQRYRHDQETDLQSRLQEQPQLSQTDLRSDWNKRERSITYSQTEAIEAAHS